MERDGDDTSGQSPLKGVVLCCTSLTTDVRTNLAEVATQMGAIHKLDLTADVTHLVVGSITTPKYQYVAKDRPDIKVLDPAWVEAVRDAWMAGGEVDVAGLEDKHRLPTFYGLQICVTGFDDMEQRGYISRTVVEQGAAYHGDLTKQITHLIAAAPQGAKYLHARQWGLKVVSLKWFADSLSRGMALDDSLYDPTMPAEEQGKGAFCTVPRSRTSLGKRIRDSNVGAAVGEEPGKKKLRRTVSTRLENQSQDVWSQMSSREGGQDAAEADRWRDDPAPEAASKGAASRADVGNLNPPKAPPHIAEPPQALFIGCHILLLGFDNRRTQQLHKFLAPNGATMLDSPDQLANASFDPLFKNRYLIIPHDDKDVKQPEVPPGTLAVTEWWVERCIHSKQLLDPVTDILSRSLSHIHIPGFSDLTVTTAGFNGVDLRQVAQAIKLIGANYQESISPGTSVIITPGSIIRKEKAFYAKKHNIPVVRLDWLFTTIDTAELAPYNRYRLEQAVPDLVALDGNASAPSPMSNEAAGPASGSAAKGKDDQPTKRLSTTRKKHATPSLALSSRTPAPTVRCAPPIVHEDEDDNDPASIDTEALPSLTPAKQSQQRPHPLQAVSPNRSPCKSAETRPEKKVIGISSETLGKPLSRTVSPDKELPHHEPAEDAAAAAPETTDPTKISRPRDQLAAELTELLLNRQTASRPGSASGNVPPNKRKSKSLGRAPSGISNRSLSASAQSESASQHVDATIDGFTTAVKEPAPPSTQLSYETAEAEAHRLQMSKKMGLTFQDNSGLKRVASIGTVKDSSFSSDAGVGTRVKGRQRTR